jgi:hypothetical protein
MPGRRTGRTGRGQPRPPPRPGWPGRPQGARPSADAGHEWARRHLIVSLPRPG